VGALFLDKGMEAVETFLSVVLYPRLEKAIHDKDWLDFKTRLQQTILYFTKKKSYAPTYKFDLFLFFSILSNPNALILTLHSECTRNQDPHT